MRQDGVVDGDHVIAVAQYERGTYECDANVAQAWRKLGR